MSEDKDLIWVTKEQAKIFNELESDTSKKELVDKLITERKIDIQDAIEGLDDDLIRLKSFAVTYKSELKKVYDEQNRALEELWETHDEKIYELKNKIKQLTPDFKEVENQINALNKIMNGISTYQIDKLIDVVHKVVNMSEADRKLMVDLINMCQVKTS